MLSRTLLVIALSATLSFAARFPDPSVDAQPSGAKRTETAVFAGGCFWGVEAIFESLNGVSNAESGYAGGAKKNPSYEAVSSGNTGHAESVKVTYDPSVVSYGQLLKVFFGAAHDPTQLNRQDNDVGTQYRSAIFYGNDDQKRIAEAYIQQLNDAKVFRKKIVTQVAPLQTFFSAEEYHQNYLVRNPTQPYIVNVDMPKLRHLRDEFPELLKKR